MSVTWFQKVADKKDNDGPIPASRAAEIENVEYEVSVNGVVETLLILWCFFFKFRDDVVRAQCARSWKKVS